MAQPIGDDVRVLVVDDIDESAHSLALLLRLNGYETRTARDGTDAVAVIKAFRPHCVVLDIRMPGMDGFELSRFLREKYRDDIVLVALTGLAPQDDRRVTMTFDLVDHYLAKPVDMAKLEKILPIRKSKLA
jgi:CheY-like chemotaxis protein